MDFTVELWIKVDTDSYSGSFPFNDPSILGNKDWSNGANQGLEIAIYTGGTYKVNFTANGISRVDQVSSGPSLEGRWNHVAVSFERNGYMRLYTNGVLTDSISISSGHGHSIDATYPYNFCDDGTGAYSHLFSGYVDEFRIWKGVRTTNEIRTYMCRTVPAGAANLMVYYPMQQTTGTTVTDASGSGHDGTLTNLTASAWVASGAAVGDTSVYLYTTSWAGQSLMVNSAGSGSFTIDTIGTGMTGIQIYRTNYPPNSNAGITLPGTDSVYFGVYPVSTTKTYNVTYDYSGYPTAMGYEPGIAVFNRQSMYTSWATLTATKNIATHTFHAASVNKYRQFVIGNFTGSAYVEPTVITAENGNNIKIYPNPTTTGTFNFESDNNEKTMLNLFNTEGVLLKSAYIENWPFIFDVTGLPVGIYFVNCNSANGNESFRVSILNK